MFLLSPSANMAAKQAGARLTDAFHSEEEKEARRAAVWCHPLIAGSVWLQVEEEEVCGEGCCRALDRLRRKRRLLEPRWEKIHGSDLRVPRRPGRRRTVKKKHL